MNKKLQTIICMKWGTRYNYNYVNNLYYSIKKHTNKNLKYNIGFEMIYLNGFTFSSNFEKIMSIKKNGKSKSDRDTFIFKISRSKEEDDEFAFNYNPLNNHQSTLVSILALQPIQFDHAHCSTVKHQVRMEMCATMTIFNILIKP